VVLELPHRVLRSVREGRLSPRHCIVDPWRSTHRAAILVGTARSGTTKVAELLCSARGSRLIFEPLHPYDSSLAPPDFVVGGYLEPGERADSLRAVWSDCLTGRAHHSSVDVFNTSRLVLRRLVKSIEATNLVPWLRQEFPDVPVVYMVRHPFAVATSMKNLYEQSNEPRDVGWGRSVFAMLDAVVERSGLLERPFAATADEIRELCRDAKDPFDRVVLRWCLENSLMLTAPIPGVPVMFYERVFQDPHCQLAEIARHLRMPISRGVAHQLEQPSVTDWGRVTTRERSMQERIGGWMAGVEPERMRAGLAILDAFGLADVYGDDEMPRDGWPTPVER